MCLSERVVHLPLAHVFYYVLSLSTSSFNASYINIKPSFYSRKRIHRTCEDSIFPILMPIGSWHTCVNTWTFEVRNKIHDPSIQQGTGSIPGYFESLKLSRKNWLSLRNSEWGLKYSRMLPWGIWIVWRMCKGILRSRQVDALSVRLVCY
jgi:hypothetical protein